MPNISPPKHIRQILFTLQSRGHLAYLVGGCVRDLIMGIAPNDWDICTSALPDEVMELFPDSLPTGIKHGTVTVIMNGTPYEVTTFRTESGYSDFRRPDSVSFVSDVKYDLARRDFTANAMCFNEEEGFLDAFGGLQDIKAKILRAVGDPETRFTEDALRIMRLFRFSAVLGFEIEKNTLEAALLLKGNLELVSRERLAEEIKKSAFGENPQALYPLLNSGALEFLGIKNGDLSKMEILPDGDLRLFAFLYILCSDVLFTVNELKMSNAFKNYCKNMLMLLNAQRPKTKFDVKQGLNLAAKEYGDFLIFRKICLNEDDSSTVGFLKEIKANAEPFRIKDLDIRGEDLAAKGLKGEEIGKALERLLKKVMQDPSINKREILIDLI